MVISIGYRVNSDKAIQFRRWATYVLKKFSKKGYIIDKKRMEKVQNKMHYAVSHQTAAEIIYNRANSKKDFMDLTTWKVCSI